MLENRIPPQNIEAEQAVLGAMLIDLEQDADIVAFLYREDYYKPATENKHTELIIAKQLIRLICFSIRSVLNL